MMLRTAAMIYSLAVAACGGGSSSDNSSSSDNGTAATSAPAVITNTATSTATSVPAPDPLLFSSGNYSIAQGSASVSLTVLRVGSAAAAVSVDYGTVDGTAIAGADYSATTGALQWDANDTTSRTIVVPISNATPFTGNKSFSVALTNPSATAQIASPDTAVVTISGNAVAAGNLQFSTATYAVAQSSKQLTVTVTRTTASSGTTSVAYATSNGTAVAGTDFTAVGGTLTWADGDASSQTVLIPISGATPFSGTKSFSITLSNPASGALLGDPNTASVAITGSASAAIGSLNLSAATYGVSQASGSLTVPVNRTGGSNGAVTVGYATTNGTAAAGQDYTAASGTLTWADGDSAAKPITLSVSGATPFSGGKTLSIALSSPGNGATISNPANATVTITGDAAPAVGTLSLAASSYSVAQNAGTKTIAVNRTAGSTGAVSVAYATSSGTAKDGTDFTGTQGTLSWADGDSASKTFSIVISNSVPFTGSKTFSVALSQAAGGADVAAPGSANVTISGDGTASGGASDAPSAPLALTVTGQGASNISLAWTAAKAADYPIDHYKIYRNGSSYSTATSTQYTDNGAANATSPTYSSAATIYSYAVSAVDSQGNEGPPTTQIAFNIYSNGVFNWKGDFSYGASANYRDTSGGPESGPYDIEINVAGPYGGFQPFAGNVVPLWDLETGAFGYMLIDLKPTIDNQTWRLSMISRLPPGDVYPWSAVQITDYGPAPVTGKWATYKIPLSALSIGKTSFQGSISGNTLTVTSVNSGVGVDAGGFISGNGVKPGTYITGHNANGGPGTYTISPSQNVSSTSMTEQRTGLYKFDVIDESGASTNHYYIDNIKLTN